MKPLSDQFIKNFEDNLDTLTVKDKAFYLFLSAIKARSWVKEVEEMIEMQEKKYQKKIGFNLTEADWTQLEFLANLRMEVENEKEFVRYVEREYCPYTW